MAKERADPLWDPDNEDQWTAFFTNHRNHELARYDGNGPPPANKNTVGQKMWWVSPAEPSPLSLTTSPRATTRD
jgi:hypothetical protein